MEKLPGWPSERQTVMGTTFAMGFMMLLMGQHDPSLWNVELFKTLITVVIVTGCVNMILAFHFSANKSDEKRMENTGKAFDALKASADATNSASGASEDDSDVIRAGDSITMEKK